LRTAAFNLKTLRRLDFQRETDQSAVAKFVMDKSDVTCGFTFSRNQDYQVGAPRTFLSQTTTFSNIEIMKWRGTFPWSIFLVA
jgi:hypothetical protein